MPETRPEEVFVSYSRQDNEKVLALTGRLREAGVGLWMDVRNIDGATLWGEEIVNAVAKSKVLLLLVSRTPLQPASEESIIGGLKTATEDIGQCQCMFTNAMTALITSSNCRSSATNHSRPARAARGT